MAFESPSPTEENRNAKNFFALMFEKNKLIGLATVGASVLLVIATSLFQIHLSSDHSNQSRNTLQTLLNASYQGVTSWSQSHKTIARLTALTLEKSALEKQLDRAPGGPVYAYPPDVQNAVRTLLRPTIDAMKYRDFHILSGDNVVLASLNDHAIGTNKPGGPKTSEWAPVWSGETIFTLPHDASSFVPAQPDTQSNQSMIVGTPLRNADGITVAILMFEFDPYVDLTRILSPERLGRTGETYAVNAVGEILSERRVDARIEQESQVAHRSPVKIEAMLNAGNTRGANLVGFRGTDGERVIGMWIWDEALGLGLVTELDAQEAREIIDSHKLFLVVLTSLTVVVILGFNLTFIYHRRRLTASREQLRQIMDLVPHMVLAKNWRGEIILANQAAAQLYGSDPQSLCRGAATTAHWTDPDGANPLNDDRHIMTTGERIVINGNTFVDAHGASHVMKTTKIPFVTGKHQMDAVLYFSTDITDQMKTEKVLRRYQNKLEQLVDERTQELTESSRELSDLYEFAPVGYLSVNLENRTISRYNATLAEMLRARSNELLGQTLHSLFTDSVESQTIANHITETAINNEAIGGIEAQLKRRDGTSFWVNIRTTPSLNTEGRPSEIRATVVNIEEKKRTDETLQESEERFRGAFETAPHGIALVSPEGRWLKVNNALCEIVGYSADELMATSFQQITHPDDISIDLAHMRRLLLGATNNYQLEKRYLHKKGDVLWILLSVSLVRDTRGNAIHFVSQFQDITEAKFATQAQNRLLAVLDAAPDIIAMADRSGRVTYLNHAGRLIIGLHDQNASSMLLTDFHPKPVADFIRDHAIPTAIAAGYCVFDSTYLTLDGREVPTSQVLVVHKDSNGEIEYFSTIARDITESKQSEAALAEAEERGRLILESAGDGIYGLDLEGRTTFVNPAAAEMLGYEVRELVGRIMHRLIQHHRSDGQSYPFQDSAVYRAMSEGGTEHVFNDEILWRKNGESFPVEYRATPIRKNNRVIGAVVTFSDITERKAIDRMKSEFVSVVSHELRTPLTSIRGALGLLVSMKNTKLPGQTVELISIAHRNSERLLFLINDLLDMEKIASGKAQFEMKVQPLFPIIEQAMINNRSYADQYGVHYILSRSAEDIFVKTDSDRLAQVLNNLLSNATKFSPRGGNVEIEVDRKSAMVRVSVTDCGSGIPEEFRDRIFQKFSQADSSDTRQKGGTGLGLAISKSLIEKMGGEIGFTSTRDQGTTFFFLIPEHRDLHTRLDASPVPEQVAD